MFNTSFRLQMLLDAVLQEVELVKRLSQIYGAFVKSLIERCYLRYGRQRLEMGVSWSQGSFEWKNVRHLFSNAQPSSVHFF